MGSRIGGFHIKLHHRGQSVSWDDNSKNAVTSHAIVPQAIVSHSYFRKRSRRGGAVRHPCAEYHRCSDPGSLFIFDPGRDEDLLGAVRHGWAMPHLLDQRSRIREDYAAVGGSGSGRSGGPVLSEIVVEQPVDQLNGCPSGNAQSGVRISRGDPFQSGIGIQRRRNQAWTIR